MYRIISFLFAIMFVWLGLRWGGEYWEFHRSPESSSFTEVDGRIESKLYGRRQLAMRFSATLPSGEICRGRAEVPDGFFDDHFVDERTSVLISPEGHCLWREDPRFQTKSKFVAILFALVGFFGAGAIVFRLYAFDPANVEKQLLLPDVTDGNGIGALPGTKRLVASWQSDCWQIAESGLTVATVNTGAGLTNGTIAAGDRVFLFHRPTSYLGPYTLAATSTSSASEKTIFDASIGPFSLSNLSFSRSVAIEGISYTLTVGSLLATRQRFDLLKSGNKIGTIQALDFWGTVYLLDLPTELSLEAKAFLLALSVTARGRWRQGNILAPQS